VTAVRKLARNRVASKRSLTYANLGLFEETMTYNPAFHANNAVLNIFFYAYSDIVDSFVIVYFLLRNITFRFYR